MWGVYVNECYPSTWSLVSLSVLPIILFTLLICFSTHITQPAAIQWNYHKFKISGAWVSGACVGIYSGGKVLQAFIFLNFVLADVIFGHVWNKLPCSWCYKQPLPGRQDSLFSSHDIKYMDHELVWFYHLLESNLVTCGFFNVFMYRSFTQKNKRIFGTIKDRKPKGWK